MKTVKSKLHHFDDLILLFLNKKSENRYLDVNITVKKSNIKNAGYGAFAETDLEPNYCCRYRSIFSKTHSGSDYVWVINENKWKNSYFTEYKSIAEYSDVVIGYADGESSRHWTRFVNCSSSPESANINVRFIGKNVYYYISNKIKKGEELLVYYGDSYYKTILKNIGWVKPKCEQCGESSNLEFSTIDGRPPKSSILCSKCSGEIKEYVIRRAYSIEYDEYFGELCCECGETNDLYIRIEGYHQEEDLKCLRCIESS